MTDTKTDEPLTLTLQPNSAAITFQDETFGIHINRGSDFGPGNSTHIALAFALYIRMRDDDPFVFQVMQWFSDKVTSGEIKPGDFQATKLDS